MALSLDANQLALVDKYRDINVDWDDWHECIVDDFKTSMLDVGIRVERVYFSGFWSQGDGACFEGSAVFPKFMDNFPDTKYPMMRKLLKHKGDVYFDCSHSGHYYHENCTDFSIEADRLYDVLNTETDIREKAVEHMDEVLNQELNSFEEEATELFRDMMRDLYKKLRDGYEYYTTDEAVWDTIVANELDKQTDEE